MNVLIISSNRNALPMPVMPIGACMVAEAAESAGHRVSLLDLMFEKDPRKAIQAAIKRSRPDVVGVSVRNIDNNDMRAPVYFIPALRTLIGAVRAVTDAPIILGGGALSVMPEELLRATDVRLGVLGDGEVVFPMLLDRISQNAPTDGLPGTAHTDNGTYQQAPCASSGFSDDCLTPDYRRWLDVAAYQSGLAAAPVQTKQGCAFKCVYCTYRKIEGNAYRFYSPESVAHSVARLAKTGLRDVELVDSVFNAPYDHAMAVCESLSRVKHGARLQCLELNPLFFDDALVSAMERAEFVGLGLTVESASDRVLQGLGKSFTSREVHKAAEVLKRHALPCAWIFLLGGPGETRETVKETLRFAETKIGPRDVAFFNVGIRIYPGTEMEAIARREGVLSLAPGDMLDPVFYVSPEVDAAWIAQKVKKSMRTHMNFISSDSIGLSFLPTIHWIGSQLGLRPPLWQHTRYIRRGLRMIGMDV